MPTNNSSADELDQIVVDAFESGYINGTWANASVGVMGDNSRQPLSPNDVKQRLQAWADRRTAAVLERLGAILQLDNNIYKVDYLLAKAIDDELAALSIKDKEEK